MERSGTVDKALRVLEVLHQARAPLSLAELARTLSIPKPTTHRLLASLLQATLVEQQADARYALGVGLVRLGLGALALDPVVRACELELERAAHELGETFFLVKARGGRLVVLSKVEGTGMLRVAPDVGSEVPVEVTASGRLYMAFAPELLAGNPGVDARVRCCRQARAQPRLRRERGRVAARPERGRRAHLVEGRAPGLRDLRRPCGAAHGCPA